MQQDPTSPDHVGAAPTTGRLAVINQNKAVEVRRGPHELERNPGPRSVNAVETACEEGAALAIVLPTPELHMGHILALSTGAL